MSDQPETLTSMHRLAHRLGTTQIASHALSWIHTVYPRGTLVSVKDAGIRIRVEKNLRSAFAHACQAENKQASDVLRDFMKAYVARSQGGQGDLFLERREEGARPAAGSPTPPT